MKIGNIDEYFRILNQILLIKTPASQEPISFLNAGVFFVYLYLLIIGMTVSIVLNGILFGILLSFLFGPAFFILINTSIKKGFKEAFFLDIGILFSDVLYLFAAYLFAEKINAYLHNNIYIKLAAGIAFIILGIVYILKKDTDVSEKSSNNSKALPKKQ